MPEAWPELNELADELQPASTRNRIFQEIKKMDSRECSWYSSKRADGIIGFLFPNKYERNEDGYPRVKVRGTAVSGLGLLGVQRGFRNAVLGELSQYFLPYGFTRKEIDLESCHTQILVDLGIGDHGIKELLGKGTNLWKHIIGKLDEEFQEEFDFQFLKGCAKRLCCKALQGGRIDTAVKIHQTLKIEEGQAKKSLESLAKSFPKNDLLVEFDLLNQAIMDRFKRHKQLWVYMPIDKTPFTFVR